MPCVMQVKMRCTLTAVSIFRPVATLHFQAMVTAMESKYLNCYMVIMHLDNMTSFHAFSLMHPNNQATDCIKECNNLVDWNLHTKFNIEWHEGDKRKVKKIVPSH